MDKLETVKKLLAAIDMPLKQQGDLCALTILAMAGLKKRSAWTSATNDWLRIHDIINFIADNYRIAYAENSRETFRKQAIHPFRTAALIEDNGKSTNSPNYRYRITAEFMQVIHSLRDGKNVILEKNVEMRHFMTNHKSLAEIYASKKHVQKMPVKINQMDFTFSPGRHNKLQKFILEEFAPRFAPSSECLYVGDTIKKDLYKDSDKLAELGFGITLHDKMPDVVLYRADKNWIYFIEAITSTGPMDSKRVTEINEMTQKVTSGKIYVSAFLDFATYKKFSADLAWETEVWIADMPEHMIHLNGDKFLGPR